MRPYVVKQGDYLTKLAHRVGRSPEEIWGHPANAELRAQRSDMDTLSPGDIVHLPDAPFAPQALQKGSANRYRATVPRVPVTLRLRDHRGEPLRDAAYRVEGLPGEATGRTDGEGAVRLMVPSTLAEVVIVLEEGQHALRVRVGHMDPIEERSGVEKRLAHLGYLVGMRGDDDGDIALRAALHDFQSDRGLTPTGELDDATRDALRTAHGS
jgi:hypothetical protein